MCQYNVLTSETMYLLSPVQRESIDGIQYQGAVKYGVCVYQLLSIIYRICICCVRSYTEYLFAVFGHFTEYMFVVLGHIQNTYLLR